jgi:putative membrane protein
MTVFSSSVSAQGMMNWSGNSSTTSLLVLTTTQDETKGKQILDELQVKQISCNNLKDDDYEVLGEYFMGQSIGNTERHAVMNHMIQSMMGQNSEEQMHISLGKRLSGCDTKASFPIGYDLLMMWLMGGGGNPMMGYGSWNNMIEGWGSFGLGWLSMLLFWSIFILGIIALIRYLTKFGGKESKTPLDILKERYAKGEIDIKGYERMKKEMT